MAPREWAESALQWLQAGESPAQVSDRLQRLQGAFAGQVAVLDAAGLSAGFTGPGAEPYAGFAPGADCCSAANLMEQPGVPEAVVTAFTRSRGSSLAARLVFTLGVGDELGGDIRGRQSASVFVAGPEGASRVDLRVDDSRHPLAELRRLLTLHEANELVAQGVDDDGHYRHVEPLLEALALAPDDLVCLSAVSLALIRSGRGHEAATHLHRLAALEPRTVQRLERLIETGHLDALQGRKAINMLARAH